jgi:hypothetical protein
LPDLDKRIDGCIVSLGQAVQVLLSRDDAAVPEPLFTAWMSAPPASSHEAWAWRRS